MADDDEFDFLHPDKHRLDEEWEKQAPLYFEYARKLERANTKIDESKAEVDVLKNELDVERAEVELIIRRKPAKYTGVEKATEAIIAAAVKVHPRVQRAQVKMQEASRMVIVAKNRAGILAAAVKALDHRKKALENLVWLHGQNYFSEPRAKDEMTSEQMERVKARAAANKGRKVKRQRDEDDDE